MNPLIRMVLAALCGLAMMASSSPAPAAVAAAPRPNFLWLIAEDFGVELGCYGTKEVFTPNLDRLAASGVRYTKSYCTAPVCSPSRSGFMTGMYQTTIGAHNHRSHRGENFPLPDGVRVITDWLRDAGYFTGNLRALPAEVGFKGTGKTDWNFTYTGKPFDTDNWADLKARQPFYAQINFSETHRTFNAPAKADPAKVELPPYYPDHPVARRDWAQYLDSASELDNKVGKILGQLERDGLADNTVVIFFGDNGQAHVRGKQFCYESGMHVPLMIRWPKGIPAPAGFVPGTVNPQLIDLIDVSATTLALAGVARPARMQGRIFLGPNADAPREYSYGARDRCDETVFRFRTVRDARYRYIKNFTPDRPLLQTNAYKEKQYPVWNLLKELNAQGKLNPTQAALCAPTMPAEELYDLETDPHEIKNLAQSKEIEHQAALIRLRAECTLWLMASDDQGRIPETPEVITEQSTPKKAAEKAQKK